MVPWPGIIDPEQLCLEGFADATTAHNRRRMTKRGISFTIRALGLLYPRCRGSITLKVGSLRIGSLAIGVLLRTALFDVPFFILSDKRKVSKRTLLSF